MRLLSKLCSLTFFVCLTFKAFSQVAIGTGANAPNPDTNAVLLLEGNGSQGIIIPKVSSLGTFGKPGMIVYNTSTGTVHYFNTAWVQVGSGGSGTQGIQISGNKVLIGTGAGFLTEFSIANTAPGANGQILMWDSSLNAGAGGWTSSAANAPSAVGQVLKWNGSRWEPGPDNVGSTTTLSGDVSGPSNNSTISLTAGNSIAAALNNAATTSKILPAQISAGTAGQVLTTTGGVAVWSAPTGGALPSLSANQLLSNNGTNTAINVAGDIGLSVSGTTGTFTVANNAITTAKINNGAVTVAKIGTAGLPDANRVLTTDASGVPQWTVAAGGGDMFKSTYDPTNINGSAFNLSNHTGQVGATQIADASITGGTAGAGVKIAANTITDANISSSAAIIGTKINPAFGAQNITTTTGSASIGGGLNVGLANQFSINNAGNITKINGATTSFPATNAVGVLTNDGAGSLTWAPAGGGTVTTVSVVGANGFNGSVANATSTPAITIGTSLTGILKGTGTGISSAAAGTDYQAPITLTTTGTSGAATLVGNTLNVPNYVGTSYTAGTGLTLTTNTFSVNTSQNISTLSNLTTNGLIKTSGGTGALSIATAGTDYLTPTGNGSALTNLNASNISSGTLPVAQVPNLDASKITTGTFGSAQITDGTIADADISGTAAIAGSKIVPAFGAQNITTTTGSGSIGGGLNVGLANGFTINNSGNITKINGATTSFPATNAVGVLTNDGAGTLTWAAGSGWGLTGNTLTGTERIGSDNAQPLAFETTNTERMRIDATGKVGIGTTTPNEKLDVAGNIRINSNDIYLLNVDGDIYHGLGWYGAGKLFNSQLINGPILYGWDGGALGIRQGSENIALRWTTAGNVGIGNIAPTEKLDITGNLKFSGALMPNNLPGTVGQVLTSAGAGIAPTWTTITGGGNMITTNNLSDLTNFSTARTNLGLGSVAYTWPATNGTGVLTNNGSGTLSWAPGGAGSVTTVSVASANGFTGTVATASSTPAITIGTSLTGLLKGNGTALSAATAGTDYQAPITLTTTGTSGAATLVGNTLNVPNYAGTSYTAGTGLTLTTNTFSVNTSQNISTLSNLTTNGLIKTSGGTGALSIATAGTDYLTPTGNGSGLTSLNASNISSGTLPVAQVPNLDASKITTGTFGSAQITDGTIADADVNASAAIAGSKINPNFGTQAISTTGTLTTGTAGAFAVNATGNITKINNVTTSFPSAQGAASTVLTNNGSGTLTWATPPTGWGLTGNAGTNPATNFIGTTDAQPLRFATGVGGVERMRIDATGNIGIGTTTPISKLNVSLGQWDLVNSEGDFSIGDGTHRLKMGVSGGGGGAGDAYIASQGGTNRLFLGNSNSLANSQTLTLVGGNVGIANTNPTEKLDITGNLKFSGALMPNNTAGTAGQLLQSNGAGAPTWANPVREVADEYTAAASQTTFTLTQPPSANSKVKMYINGIRVSNTAYNIVGTTLTYNPANNGTYALTAGDRIQCDYFY
ncbi:MAG: hypothetical protein ING84_06675 [Cytophagales bacterium]|nr:hypothetical protein [Cytophagales bacterium]MCA6365610.1 hypothetical protein [Cytophagales bacterium]MCA6372553.1 hypothetical protein [Cytophagales bacterium]MCA6375567.1 hypothetical protein [Cytophagales bacterium]MCA6383168.1 hypothetical protein [Cytophagales bacterium]